MSALYSNVRSLRELAALAVPSATSLEGIPEYISALIKHYNVIRMQKWWRTGLIRILYCKHLAAHPVKFGKSHGVVKYRCGTIKIFKNGQKQRCVHRCKGVVCVGIGGVEFRGRCPVCYWWRGEWICQ